VSKSNGKTGGIVIKKYANRRLYDTSTSQYVTLDYLRDLVKKGTDFQVVDAKSGEDLTRGVLAQIIFEEESRGANLLPVDFLRQLIGFYGDSLQSVVPGYLQMSMNSFSDTQKEWRKAAKAAAGSKGIDVVYDPIGGPTAEPALRMLNPGGRFLVVGFVTGIATIPLNLPLLKQCSIHGVNWGGAVMTNPTIVPPVISTLVEWTLSGKLKPQADQRYPLERSGEAFAALFERRSIGKIVICPQQ